MKINWMWSIGLTILLTLFVNLAFGEVPKYERKEFGYGWIDEDKDGEDTRQEVLKEESYIKTTTDSDGDIIAGLWVDPLTGKIFFDPSDLDIDHIVPLKEAWLSGAHAWTKEERIKYANDLNNKRHLIAVYKSANRSKGSRSPDQWMPANTSYWCEYISIWEEVKLNYGLTMDANEFIAIQKYKRICDRFRIKFDTKAL